MQKKRRTAKAARPIAQYATTGGSVCGDGEDGTGFGGTGFVKAMPVVTRAGRS